MSADCLDVPAIPSVFAGTNLRALVRVVEAPALVDAERLFQQDRSSAEACHRLVGEPLRELACVRQVSRGNLDDLVGGFDQDRMVPGHLRVHAKHLGGKPMKDRRPCGSAGDAEKDLVGPAQAGGLNARALRTFFSGDGCPAHFRLVNPARAGLEGNQACLRRRRPGNDARGEGGEQEAQEQCADLGSSAGHRARAQVRTPGIAYFRRALHSMVRVLPSSSVSALPVIFPFSSLPVMR